MNAEQKSQRNLTAYGMPFHPEERPGALPWSVPDALIHALSAYPADKLFEYSNIPDHFVAAGFTDADLVLGEQLHGSSGLGWMAQVLRWDPKAKLGEPGHWTWAPPHPTIADRLRVALYALTIARETVDGVFFPGAHAAAQRVLSEVLLQHPVLMHPRVRVNIGLALNTKSGTCSVAHAIALTPNARFPTAADWPVGQAPMSDLRAFANATVVQRVLLTSVRSPRHRDELELAKGRSYFTAAMRRDSARPALLHSLHSLGRLMDRTEHDSAAGRILEDWKALHRPEDSIHKSGVLAHSFFAACGVIEGRRSREQAELYREDGFLGYVASLFEDEKDKLMPQMRVLVFESLFGRGAASYNGDEVEYNLRSVMRGCARAGLLDGTESGAAHWVRKQLKDVGTPAVETAAALGFIRTMRAFNVELLPEHFSVFKRNGLDQPLEDSAPGWAAALRIDAAERSMLEVIGVALAPERSSSSDAALRRRRVACL